MLDKLRSICAAHGDRVAAVPVERLENLREDIAKFAERDDLNGFQKWIISDLYNFNTPTDFTPKSIIIHAMAHPIWANLEIQWKGKTHKARTLVNSNFKTAAKYITDALAEGGYRCWENAGLPMKRLAVCSSLAEYGRNNITYVDGLGSMLSYTAYFSDMPCEDNWREMTNSARCNGCDACIKVCPTGAILKDRFLIDNSRCLSAINESGGDAFPDWLPANVHHTPYDCLRCQEVCPMNVQGRKIDFETIVFDEKTTGMLLDGKGYNDFDDDFKAIADHIDIFRWAGSIPRNIRALVGEL